MCGRMTITRVEQDLEARFRATFNRGEEELFTPLPNFNVAPTHVLPILTQGDDRTFLPMRWGLIPHWAKDLKTGLKMINARLEGLLETAPFKQLIAQKRCLVPADGYYEWMKDGVKRHPYRITTSRHELFAIAGLWSRWTDPAGHTRLSFTVLTTIPAPVIAHIHDRMPVILSRSVEDLWLDQHVPVKEAMDLLIPPSSEDLRAYRVSRRVGDVRQNESALIEEDDSSRQLDLFE